MLLSGPPTAMSLEAALVGSLEALTCCELHLDVAKVGLQHIHLCPGLTVEALFWLNVRTIVRLVSLRA